MEYAGRFLGDGKIGEAYHHMQAVRTLWSEDGSQFGEARMVKWTTVTPVPPRLDSYTLGVADKKSRPYFRGDNVNADDEELCNVVATNWRLIRTFVHCHGCSGHAQFDDVGPRRQLFQNRFEWQGVEGVAPVGVECEGEVPHEFLGIRLEDLMTFERLFDLAITIFTLRADSSVEAVWLLKKRSGQSELVRQPLYLRRTTGRVLQEFRVPIL